MKTGVSYMGHHNPKHLAADFAEMRSLDLDDVLLAAQENDFHYFPGKLRFTPALARDHGLRPLVILWGALNLFGGGRSSQFLLENPDCFQVDREGRRLAAGCYVNPKSVAQMQAMIDITAECGFAGYFVDEPTPLRACFCPSCRSRFAETVDGDLATAPSADLERFRQQCVVDYTAAIARYCKANHPHLETLCCLMPVDQAMWEATAALPDLDNLGTDVYWVNDDRDVEEMTPIVRDMAALTQRHHKVHHEWLQCWKVQRGREPRIRAQGEILLREQPDALYIWAWAGQVGTAESCEDPDAAWAVAVDILRRAKAT